MNISNGSIQIPGLTNLQDSLGTIMLWSSVIGGLFIVLYIINLIQRMRADRAMIAMHKDIAEIKVLLQSHTAPTPRATHAESAVASASAELPSSSGPLGS